MEEPDMIDKVMNFKVSEETLEETPVIVKTYRGIGRMWFLLYFIGWIFFLAWIFVLGAIFSPVRSGLFDFFNVLIFYAWHVVLIVLVYQRLINVGRSVRS